MEGKFVGTYISMLRGINVSGQKKIAMAELKKLYESLGFKNVQTYIQSGNVIFECPDTDASKLASRIEKKIKRSFGFDVPVLIRTKDEFRKLIENTPFSKSADWLYVSFLSSVPANSPIGEINKMKDRLEEFSMSGMEIYLFCPGGYGKTKLSNSLFERKLKVAATTRNWRTVNALFSMAK